MNNEKRKAMLELVDLYQQLEFVQNDSSSKTVELFINKKEEELLEMLKEKQR